MGDAAVASLGVTGTLVFTLARPLAAWPMPAKWTLCGEEIGDPCEHTGDQGEARCSPPR